MDRPAIAAAAPPLARLLLHERVVLLGALGLVVAVSWAYLGWAASGMSTGADAWPPVEVAMPGLPPSSAAYPLWLFLMWAVTSTAMMLPTALPLILLFARLWRGRHPALPVAGPTAELVLGYLAAWIAFGSSVALLQLGLEGGGLVTPMMGQLRSAAVAGATLVGVGLFQLTPLKAACLAKCRSPLMFLMTRWREGRHGAFFMGLDHGVYCLGCCWALMLVMFVAGVMNVAWMAALTILMTLEKIVWRGDLLARGAGVALVGAGLWLALG